MTENNTGKQIIEAALFAAGSTVTAETLMKISRLSKKEVSRLVSELQNDYSQRESGIEIVDLSGHYVMQIKPDFAEKVKDVAPKELTSPQLKTLSIIAYHQPITKSMVVEMRGSNAYDHISELEERGFLDLKPHGRTKMIKTTRLFAEYFGISSGDTADIRNKMVEIMRLQGGGQSHISGFGFKKRLSVTPMYESLLRMCGMTDYKVVNPYEPTEKDLQILEETDILIMAKGYADKLKNLSVPYGGQILEMSSTTFGDLVDDLQIIAKELGENFSQFGKMSKVEENIKDLKELQDIYRSKAFLIKTKASPVTEMSAKILGELGIGLAVDGIAVSPDYKTPGGKKVKKEEITFPTHKNQSGNLIKRVCEKYDAVIDGLKEADKTAKKNSKSSKTDKNES